MESGAWAEQGEAGGDGVSMKLYYAYSWDGDILSLLRFLNGLRETYLNDCATEFYKRFRFEDQFDFLVNQTNLYRKIVEGSARQERFFPFDAELSCVVYQFEGKTVIQFFGYDRRKYPRMSEKIESLPDVSYWDNTGGPEDVPEAEFEARGKWFNGLFEALGSDVPARCGLAYEFGSKDAYFEISERVAYMWEQEGKLKDTKTR